MSATFVIVARGSGDGAVWFGKNSVRAPGAAHVVERWQGSTSSPGHTIQTSGLHVPQAQETHAVILSRPTWMWGADMGVNAHGVAVGVDPTLTRVPVPSKGLSGGDLTRLALERSTSARDALECITSLLRSYGQGGPFNQETFGPRFHSAFIIADPKTAWVLETAGPFWAAVRVRGSRALHPRLTIDDRFDLLGEGTYAYAKSQGWCESARDFDFSQAFGLPTRAPWHASWYERERLFRKLLSGHRHIDPSACVSVLSGAASPLRRQRGMGLVHDASSMFARLHPDHAPKTWWTGTSTPALSVFKPVDFDAPAPTGERPGEHCDARSLYWRHEVLQRAVARDPDQRAWRISHERRELQDRALAADASPRAVWSEHTQAVTRWTELVASAEPHRPRSLAHRAERAWWSWRNLLDRAPTI